MSDTEIKEQVKEATDIVGVIGQFVALKKRGSNYLGLCPFHTEKTPSFNVHGDRQFFHCFGCGKGGDVFTFLMEHEGWTFPEALKYCADRAGIRLPERHTDDDREGRRRKAIFDALSMAGELYHRVLFSSAGKTALDYLHNRGFTDETLRRAGVGYAPPAYDTLLRGASTRGIHDRALLAAGLVLESQRNERPYDRFRNRVIFPIHSLNGKIVGFGGRTLSADEPAKYINSPETEVYHKGRILYGLHVAREAIRRAECAILVEGYMDWLAMLQHGLENVVAVSGTALTDVQAALLSRFCSRITLMYDADSAGQRAALRGIDIAFNAGLAVDILPLPEGDDPDSFLKREGADELQRLIQRAPTLIQFRIAQAEKAYSGPLDFIVKERLMKYFVDLGGRIVDLNRREAFITEAAFELKFPESGLRERTGSDGLKSSPTDMSFIAKGKLHEELVFISLLLKNRALIERARSAVEPSDFSVELYRKMFSELLRKTAKDQALPDVESLAESDQEAQLWRLILTDDYESESPELAFEGAFKSFRKKRLRLKSAQLKDQIESARREGNEAEVERLFNERLKLDHDGV